MPTPEQLVAIACAFGCLFLQPGRFRRGSLALATLALFALEANARAPTRRFTATMLDVGQGDGVLLELPNGQGVLVDAGGNPGGGVDVGSRVVAPELRARRRSTLALVVLSHPHPDHYLGLRGALEGVTVQEVWDTGERPSGRIEALDSVLDELRERGTRIRSPAELCGVPQWFGATRFDVLAPCPNPSPDRSVNDNSLVIRVSFGARSMLLTGDAESETERELVEHLPGTLSAEILKVGHHGSATSSSPEFVDLVSPRFALVSTGVRNRFGHPRPSTLSTLKARQIKVCRTDVAGACTVKTNGLEPWTLEETRHPSSLGL